MEITETDGGEREVRDASGGRYTVHVIHMRSARPQCGCPMEAEIHTAIDNSAWRECESANVAEYRREFAEHAGLPCPICATK